MAHYSKSDSTQQRIVEKLLIDKFSNESGITLSKKRMSFGSGKNVFSMEVDGYSEKPRVLCEAWAHVGTPKGAQPRKITNDALKLLFLEKKIGKKCRKIILFADERARKPFISKGWASACFREYDIETMAIELPLNVRKSIIEKQKDMDMTIEASLSSKYCAQRPSRVSIKNKK